MTALALPAHYDSRLVCLSVAIAIAASYVALNVASRVAARRGKEQLMWLGGGAFAMGTGIWAMHYIGMLAFAVPVPVQYDLPTVGISLLAAMLSSAVALFVVSRDRMGIIQLAYGSLVMGGGICAMHYIGMMAMRLSAHCVYSPWIVAASLGIAVAVSGIALWITFRLRDETGKPRWIRLVSAVVMGFAVCSMHYTGMAAACFHPAHLFGGARHSVAVSSLGLVGVTTVTFLILFFVVLGSMADKYLSLQREYRLSLERNLAAFWRTTLDGRILDANDTALRLLGYKTLQDLQAIRASECYWNPEDRLRIIDELRNHGVVNGIEVCLKHQDGTPVWVIYNLTLSRTGQDGSAEIMASAVDISVIKKTQQELLLAKEHAESVNRAKSQFLANMSHELRTPLNGIVGMTNLALDCEISADARECLQIVDYAASNLMTMVSDVLDFSKSEAEKLVLETHSFQLQQVVDNALRLVAGQAKQKSLKLITDFTTAAPKTLIGDAGRIRQILVNLFSNAIKFTQEGEIVLKLESVLHHNNNAVVHMSVRDTGIGIPESKLGVIFDPFVQADTSDTRKFGGTGLGLTICTQLAEAMGGRIWVESTLGKGSTFRFTITAGLPDESDGYQEKASPVGELIAP